MLVRAVSSGVIYSRKTIVGKVKKLGTLIQLSGVKVICGRNFLSSLELVGSNFKRYLGLVSFIDPSQEICGVVSTHNEANARSVGLVVMLGMRRHFKKVQLIDLNGLFKVDNLNKIDRDLLGQVDSMSVYEDCEILQLSQSLPLMN